MSHEQLVQKTPPSESATNQKNIAVVVFCQQNTRFIFGHNPSTEPYSKHVGHHRLLED